MSENTDIAKSLIRKLNGWQSFIVLSMIVLGFGVIPVVNSRTQVDSTNVLISEVRRLSRNLENANINTVDYTTACEIYRDVFRNSMYTIVRMAMVTITNNNIDDPRREAWIRAQYYTEIMALYNDDITTLNKIRFKGKRLGTVMMNLDPNETINSVLTIIFDMGISHEQKLKDIDKLMMNQAETYYQKGITYLNKE